MHGVRLIDGALLEQRIDSAIKKANDCFDFVLAARLFDFKHTVQDQPTIEAEPVRHGRWITKDSKTAKCSFCGWWQHARMYYLPDDIQEFSKCYLFCTACGTKMDGGAENA